MEISFAGFMGNLVGFSIALVLLAIAVMTVVGVLCFAGLIICMCVNDDDLEEMGVHRPRCSMTEHVDIVGFEEFTKDTINLYDTILQIYKEENEF